MSTVHSRWPLYPVPYTRAQNGQPGYSDLLTTPAANAATLADWVDGLGTYGASLNPSAEYGHDHSGGDQGKPFFRSVFSSQMTATASSAYKGSDLLVFMDGESATGYADGVTNNGKSITKISFWVPPCDPVNGAYNQLGISAKITTTASTLVSGDAVYLVLRNVGTQQTAKIDVGGVSGTFHIQSGVSTKMICTQGRHNVIEIDHEVTRGGTGSVRYWAGRLDELELGVYST